jgi:hypothetical protein
VSLYLDLPTAALNWESFEKFLEDLLVRLRLVPGATPRLVSSSGFGRQGQDQKGIDQLGTYDDGTTCTWQCKQHATLSAADVRKIIKDTEIQADKHVIVFSRVADALAREEAGKMPGWEIWDRDDLANFVRTLPKHEGRTLLDTHFDTAFRRRFLDMPSQDMFLMVDEFFRPLLAPGKLFHHRTRLVGRNHEREELISALTTYRDSRVVILEAATGRGKTRLVLEVLQQVRIAAPLRPALISTGSRRLDSDALAELPDGPAVIVVEDVHRDLPGLPALLDYAVRTDGTQLMVTTHGAATQQVRALALAAQFDTSRIEVLKLSPLSLPSSRELVTTLQRDAELRLTDRFAEHLARQTPPFPVVAVLAVALVRAGELTTASLTLNAKFTDEVMGRYGTAIIRGITDVPTQETEALLALVAGLSPVNLADDELSEGMAIFLGIDKPTLLRRITLLVDHGALLLRGTDLRVVTDVLADELLTRHLVQAGVDTGEAARMWARFGTLHRFVLLRNLADAARRIELTAARVGDTAPDVFDDVWAQFSAEAVTADARGRSTVLGELGGLPLSQPRRAFNLVQQLLQRPSQPAVLDDGLYQYPVTHAQVEEPAAAVLRACASVDPTLLPDVLDHLWDLAKTDDRAPHSHPQHPLRQIEELVAFDADPSFKAANVLLDDVVRWLQTLDAPDAAHTPLSVMKPLLQKNYMIQQWQLDAIGLSERVVDPHAARPMRDRARTLLLDVGQNDTDIRRTVQATELLARMMVPPAGMFGREVTDAEVLSWETDDLATLQALQQIAHHTNEPLIRLTIRNAIAPYTTREPSTDIAARSRAIIEALDDHPEDALTDVLLGYDGTTMVELSGRRQAAVTSYIDEHPGADRLDNSGLPANVAFPEGHEYLARRVHEQNLVAIELWGNESPPHVVQILTDRLAVLTAARRRRDRLPAPGLEQLLDAVGRQRPQHTRALLDTIKHTDSRDLQAAVHVLLNQLATREPAIFTAVLDRFVAGTNTLAAGALQGFGRYSWARNLPSSAHALLSALEHPDQTIAATAVANMADVLKADPPRHAARLIATAEHSPWAVNAVLLAVSLRDREAWIESLSRERQLAMLSIMEVAEDWDWAVQTLLTEIAKHLPIEALRAIARRYSHGTFMPPHQLPGLADAINLNQQELLAWTLEAATAGGSIGWGSQQAWPYAAGIPLGEAGAATVTAIAARRETAELAFLVDALGDIEGFVLDRPDLVALLLDASTVFDQPTRKRFQNALSESAGPRYWRDSGEPTSKILDIQRSAVALADDHDHDQQTRAFYAGLIEECTRIIARDQTADTQESE